MVLLLEKKMRKEEEEMKEGKMTCSSECRVRVTSLDDVVLGDGIFSHGAILKIEIVFWRSPTLPLKTVTRKTLSELLSKVIVYSRSEVTKNVFRWQYAL